MSCKACKRMHREVGAALLAAMLTVTLVATFAAAALWQQWRAVEVESAERARAQSSWVLVGALDWARLILSEDARSVSGSGNLVDSLSEPWAVPLAEARLSSFLAADKNISSDALEGLPDAFLSGRILDAQAKMNVLNLVSGGQPVKASQEAFTRLFQLLQLPAGELSALVSNLQRATAGTTAGTAAAAAISTATAGSAATATATAGAVATDSSATPADGGSSVPLLPQQASQLVWLGLSAPTLAALQPYVTILPVRTTLNLNTASAEAIYASHPTIDLAGAKRVVAARARSAFTSLGTASSLLPLTGKPFESQDFSVATRYFEVYGRLRLDRTWVEERSLLQRDNLEVKVVWRERGAGTTAGRGQTLNK